MSQFDSTTTSWCVSHFAGSHGVSYSLNFTTTPLHCCYYQVRYIRLGQQSSSMAALHSMGIQLCSEVRNDPETLRNRDDLYHFRLFRSRVHTFARHRSHSLDNETGTLFLWEEVSFLIANDIYVARWSTNGACKAPITYTTVYQWLPSCHGAKLHQRPTTFTLSAHNLSEARQTSNVYLVCTVHVNITTPSVHLLRTYNFARKVGVRVMDQSTSNISQQYNIYSGLR